MRLIDADALYYKVKCECNPYGKPTIDFESGKKVLDWIEKAPTLDRPRGEWERNVYGKRYCSACGQRAIYHATTVRPLPHLTNFCPNCGADMRIKTDLN